ncbi:hypothetical protein I7I51_02856 [Histoplasma capsulatum]|uniref:Uncharacterized protein n=1 Tax=Ajellomyces capsulatus TaxID=5037 RepID=A0A8A1MJL4_AJECA|nr:hypothetical protein I7I51_02856 [Histoplasma capsulatum]
MFPPHHARSAGAFCSRLKRHGCDLRPSMAGQASHGVTSPPGVTSTGWRIPHARTGSPHNALGASPKEELHAGPAAPSPLQAKNSIISCHCQFATSQHNHSFAGREGSDRSDQPTDPPITMLGPPVAPR